MKVMHINAVYGVGSTGVIVEDLHNLALSDGIESYVAYSTSPVSADKIINGYKIGSVVSKKIHAILSRIIGKQAYFSCFDTKKLLKYIDGIEPDIIHLHNLHSNYINLNMLLRYIAEKNIRTVITLHDCWFYTGGCFHYTSSDCFKWLEKCGDCPQKNNDVQTRLKDNSRQILADRKKYLGNIQDLTIVGVSDWISNEAKRTFLKDKNVVTIHNGIDTERYVYTPSDFREKHNLENKFLILTAANKWLKPINKETLDYVTQNLPDDCVIIMLGCKNSDIERLPENVLPLEYVNSREELIKIYSACDVFANCTREESLSLINVEAQSCGTPVVTYGNTGVRETVDNKCGFSVETGNAEDFLKTILKIKELSKSSFFNECHLWANNSFDRDKNYLKYIDLYKSEIR